MGRRETPLAVGDMVVLPQSDILLPGLRPVGVGIVLGEVDLTNLPKWRHRNARECVVVLFGDKYHTFNRSRLRKLEGCNPPAGMV